MKVAVVTGSRADYGLLRPTIGALRDSSRFEVALFATAMHLEDDYGLTVRDIEADGNSVIRVPIMAEGGEGAAEEGEGAAEEGEGAAEGGESVYEEGESVYYARRLGHATIAFTDALAASGADLLLVLGDRFEVLAASLAATGLAVPIAHVHGGELSEGSLDDAMRHCVTKLAHLHFVSTRHYGERVCQLGEEPWRVHVVGAAAIESIRELDLLDRAALADALELRRLEAPLIALTLHPVSLEPDEAGVQAAAVIAAVDEILDGRGTVVLTLPNDDPGSRSTRAELLRWSERSERVHAYASLGQLRYLSLLRNADAVVGNSSSAIIEAPSFRVPVVNIGDRQRGRIMAPNVLSCPPAKDEIVGALRRALDPGFRTSLADLVSPYGDGRVSRRILEVLADAPSPDRLRNKRFSDLPDGPWRTALEFGTR